MRLVLAVLAIAAANLSAPPAVQAEENLRVILDWFINPDHGPLYVAQEKGYFAAQGMKVTFTEPGDPNDPPKLVAAGEYDLAVSYQPSLHMQVAAGLPLVRVGTLVATPLNSLVVLEDGPITSIADLKGKRIGYSVGGFEEALLTAMLGNHGLTMADVTLINVNFSLSPSLMSGQVDAVIGAYRNFELNQMDIEKHPGRAFYPEEHGVPAYDELILVAHRERADDRRFARFLEAVEAGVQYLVNYPEESWQLFIKGRPELDDELNRRAWRDTLPRFALRPAALDTTRYQRFADFLAKHGLAESAPPLSEYAVQVK